jgi:hypothetical protein
MINIILFSKDRPAQCDLFLSSMKEFFSEYKEQKINVLYTFSNKEFEKGYKKLIQYYPDINFVLERSFKSDLLNLITENQQHTVFFVDDIIWKNKFTFKSKEFEKFKTDHHILCLSLRLDPNLTYCYTANLPMTKPKTFKDGMWYWKMEPAGDFSYPMSVDGHIFRTEEILPLLKSLNYKNPNSLESSLSFNPLQKAKMICFEESIVVNNPCNKVQTNNPNKHGNITANELNKKFLDGERLDFEIYRGIKNISCHQELPIKFK